MFQIIVKWDFLDLIASKVINDFRLQSIHACNGNQGIPTWAYRLQGEEGMICIPSNFMIYVYLESL